MNKSYVRKILKDQNSEYKNDLKYLKITSKSFFFFTNKFEIENFLCSQFESPDNQILNCITIQQFRKISSSLSENVICVLNF